jgi:hypothetical protein
VSKEEAVGSISTKNWSGGGGGGGWSAVKGKVINITKVRGKTKAPGMAVTHITTSYV